jgi:outer membrane protein OmpA-like peptidoglycan-associated protein
MSQLNVINYSVYFESDTYELPSKYIDSLILSWNLNSIDSLQIEGHCDSDGSNEYNLKLAERRIRFILSRLDNNGFDSSGKSINISALGESAPKYSNNSDQNKLKNRRVDILYVLKPQESKIKEPAKPKPVEVPVESAGTPKIKLTEEILNQRIEESLKTGENIELEDILFRPGLDVFQPYSMPTLEILYKVMSSRKDLRIEIQGHVCCVADGQRDGNNYRNGSNHLSEDRAEAVKEYLVNLGINPRHVQTKGFGGSKRLIYPELTEADMARNRRVEIRIMNK